MADVPLPEPIGYVSKTGHGTYFRETITPELAALEQGGRKMWTPVVAAPPAAPAVPLTQLWCPETGELCSKCAKTGTCEASMLQAHGIGGGNG